MNFLLVLGVQKGGTTWLHQQLAHHPQYESAHIKEWKCIRKATKASIKEQSTDNTFLSINKEDWVQRNDQDKRRFASKNLFNYLSIQFSASKWDSSRTRCIGDATPENGLANEEILEFFKQSAERAGFSLKPVLLMRDPTSRHLSASIMNYSIKVLKDIKNSGTTSYDPTVHAEALDLHAIKKIERWKLRGQYEKQIPLFDKVFGRDCVKYIFSDDLRKNNAIDIVTDYLDLDQFGTAEIPDHPQAKGANARIKHKFKVETREKVRTAFTKTYQFISERFGDDVPDAWLT